MLIYVCHPYTSGEWSRGRNVAENRARIERILHSLRRKHGDEHTFVSPVHCFSWLSASDDAEDADARRMGLELVGACDAVWVFGDWQASRGCCEEVSEARSLDMPILLNGEVWL